MKRPPPPPATTVEVVREPAEPSAFEQKWSAACGDGGAVGQCPAPFDRPAVFVDVSESEQATPPFCGAIESAEHAGLRDAIAAKRKALKGCFRGAEPGSFVELGPDGAVISDPARAKMARAEACVAKAVKKLVAAQAGPKPERVIILQSASAKPSEQALSKESLDAVANEHAGEVSACYDGALAVWPGLKGRVATRFVIWFDGQVALARTGESSVDNAMLECCINTAVRSWTFPKPKDGSIALVTFPFTLGPQD